MTSQVLEFDDSYQRAGPQRNTFAQQYRSSVTQANKMRSTALQPLIQRQQSKNQLKQRLTNVNGEYVWWPREPSSNMKCAISLLINSAAELLTCFILIASYFFNRWFLMSVALVSHAMLVSVPLIALKEPTKRVKFMYMQLVGFIGVSALGFAVFWVLSDLLWPEILMNALVVTSIAVYWYVFRNIHTEVTTSVQLKVKANTYIQNRHFATQAKTFKYLFIAASIIESFVQPSITSLVTQVALFVIFIKSVTFQQIDRNRQSLVENRVRSSLTGMTEWVSVRGRLMNLLCLWQRIVVSVKTYAIIAKIDLQPFGGKNSDNYSIYVNVSVLLFVWLYSKSVDLREQFAYNDTLLQAGSSQMTKQQEDISNRLFKTALSVFKILTFDKRKKSKIKQNLYGFLPVLLNWLVRITVGSAAYYFRGEVGFWHLFWVIISFFVEQKLFYALSVLFVLPIVFLEYVVIYLAQILPQNSEVFEQDIAKPYIITCDSFELSFLYFTLLTVGLMVPARIRFVAYNTHHQGSDMTKDILVKKLKHERSSLLWKLLFIVAVRLHTPVLYLMLFFGSQNLSLFQLGFMGFFVAYSASDTLYMQTSVLLPAFVSVFILSQYYWSYNFNEDYDYKADFYFIGQPNQMPSLSLWILMLLMNLIHLVNYQFPDAEQNESYILLCQRHISQRLPTVTKWLKVAFDISFLAILIVAQLILGNYLVQQKSTLINLVYLILFVMTTAQMVCSKKIDIWTNAIKTFSAIVLAVVVCYHILKFQLLNSAMFRSERPGITTVLENEDTWPLNLMGLPEKDDETKSLIQLYTFYLIFGQILEYNLSLQELSYHKFLFTDWSMSSKVNLELTHQRLLLSKQYISLKLYVLWKQIDYVCKQWYFVTHCIIIYFAIYQSLSLYFAILVTTVAYFYFMTKSQVHLTADDLQMASNMYRQRAKDADNYHLKLRRRVWWVQFVLTIIFVFIGYLDEFLIQFAEDPEASIDVEKWKFNLFWLGSYYKRSVLVRGLDPVEIMFLVLLLERLTQDWSESRLGVNKTTYERFVKLEFLRGDKEWLPDEKSGVELLGQPKIEFTIPKKDELSAFEFDTVVATLWRQVKFKTYLRTVALPNGLREVIRAHKGKRQLQLKPVVFQTDHDSPMALYEFLYLSELMWEHLQFDFWAPQFFRQYFTTIDNKKCIVFSKVIEPLRATFNKRLRKTVDVEMTLHEAETIREQASEKLTHRLMDKVEALSPDNWDVVDSLKQSEYERRLHQGLAMLIKFKCQWIVDKCTSEVLWALNIICFTVNAMAKSNFVSLVLIGLVTLKLFWRLTERNALRVQAVLLIAQYWTHVSKLSEANSPTSIPSTYSRITSILHSYDLQFLVVDFVQLVLLSWLESASQTLTIKNRSLKGNSQLQEYHNLMKRLYPNELHFGATSADRLSKLKEDSTQLSFVKVSKILTYLLSHIITLALLMMMAVCRSSLLSIGYFVIGAPHLFSAVQVLQQFNKQQQMMQQVSEHQQNVEFCQLTQKQQEKIIKKTKAQFRWSLTLQLKYLLMFAFVDFSIQLAAQFIGLQMDGIGLRLIHKDGFQRQNLMYSLFSCVTLAVLYLQQRIWHSDSYIEFINSPEKGLSKLMALVPLKQAWTTYEFNNQKLVKILTIQKTEQQIYGCVDRIKLNYGLFKQLQSRQMLEEYCRTYGGKYIPPPEFDQVTEQVQQSADPVVERQQTLTLGKVLKQEKERRKLLLTDHTQVMMKKIPLKARFYLWLLRMSNSVLTISSEAQLERLILQATKGDLSTAESLVRHITNDLNAYLIAWEAHNKTNLTQWPEIQLSEMRLTNSFCSQIDTKIFAALGRIVISNIHIVSYFFMIQSAFVTAGLLTIVYPIAVFGYALLEETRPTRKFWRIFLYYTVVLVILKFVMNLPFSFPQVFDTNWQSIDGFIKIGLEQEATPMELFWNVLPEVGILITICSYEVIAKLNGLFDVCESDIENVTQAIDRIYAINTGQTVPIQDELDMSFSSHLTESFNDDDDDFHRATSDEDSLVSEHDRKSIWQSAYMCRVFPRVQQQKPGTDYYGYLTFVQAILNIYLILSFDSFAASNPYKEDNIFQPEMVIVLLYQMSMMIIDRIVARTENRRQIERMKRYVSQVQPTIDRNELFVPQQYGQQMVSLVVKKLKFQYLADKANLGCLMKMREQQEIQLTDAMVTPQQKWKFVIHWLHLIIVHAYIFWYLPLHSNMVLYGSPICPKNQECKDFTMNDELQIYYMLHLCYFFFSARQISQGLPSFRRGSSTTLLEGTDSFEEIEDVGNALHQIFINIPLAVEIRCILDFAFTRTALDMWQTCQTFQYTSDFFIAKNNNMYYNRKGIGDQPYRFTKIFFGYVLTSVMLTFLLGPFVLFSSLGGMAIYNPVIDARFEFWVQINFTTTSEITLKGQHISWEDQSILPFKLYENAYPQIYSYDSAMFEVKDYNKIPQTKFFDYNQVQTVLAQKFSDTKWTSSRAQREQLQKYACEVAPENTCPGHINDPAIHNVTLGFMLKQEFVRQGPAGAEKASGIQYRILNATNSNDLELLRQFSTFVSITHCTNDRSILIDKFYTKHLLLKDTTEVHDLQIEKPVSLNLTYFCDDEWAVAREQDKQIELTIFSQRISTSWLQGYNILTFYAGIVLVFGSYLRPVFVWNTNRAFIYECNYPDAMLRLCESIYLSRARGDLKTEEENFRLLQDILRSPELLHWMTGSNVKSNDPNSLVNIENRANRIPKAFNALN